MDSSCSRTQITTEIMSEYVMKPAHAPAVPPHCDGDKALRIETDRDSSLWIETPVSAERWAEFQVSV